METKKITNNTSVCVETDYKSDVDLALIDVLQKNYNKLITAYVKHLLYDNKIAVPQDIDWRFSLKDLTLKNDLIGYFDNKKVIVNATTLEVTLEKVEKMFLKTFFDDIVNEDNMQVYDNGVSFVEELPSNEELPPIPIIDDDYNETDDETLVDDEYVKIKEQINNCIHFAKSKGFTDLFINSNGSICTPVNSKQNILEFITLNNNPLTINQWDILVDKIIKDYKNVQVIEDIDCLLFYLE